MDPTSKQALKIRKILKVCLYFDVDEFRRTTILTPPKKNMAEFSRAPSSFIIRTGSIINTLCDNC